MSEKETRAEPRDRIIEAAIRLFASKGFSATGVRELAGEAGVNIAMISYYFGSKKDVLKELIDVFFTEYERVIMNALKAPGTLEDKARRVIPAIVGFFGSNPNLVRIILTEFPMEMPEIAEFKAERVLRLKAMGEKIARIDLSAMPVDPAIPAILGPAGVSMISSHFLLKPVVENLELAELDEKFYRLYPKVITDLFLGGVTLVLQKAVGGQYNE